MDIENIKKSLPDFLVSWLKKEGVYDKYIANIEKQPVFCHNFPDDTKYYNWIADAFRWSYTDDGFDFWCSKNDKFKKEKPWEKKLAPKDSLDDVRKAISSNISGKLKAFLTDNGAFDKFIENIRLFRYEKPIETIADASKMRGCDPTISGAFAWSETPEGNAFWSGLDCKYSKMSDYVESIRKAIKETLPDGLREFLKSNGALDKFVENLRLQQCPHETDADKAKTIGCKCASIMLAFTWCKTPEGADYWRELDTKYRDTSRQKETNPREEDKKVFRKLPEWFIRWLTSKDILEKYRDNMFNYPMYPHMDITYPRSFIGGAFYWNETPEGSFFWMDINDKYEDERPWETPICGDSSCPTLGTDEISRKELPPSDNFIPKLPCMDTSKLNIKLF